MSGDYKACKKELLALRNSLVHNAINLESFLSHAEMDSNWHLREIGAGFFYVNTMVMYKDFVDSFTRFRSEIQRDPVMMMRAADRLVWVETVDRLEGREDNPLDQKDNATPTPPPPVRFIRAKCNPKRH
jgi:hypothetical protein